MKEYISKDYINNLLNSYLVGSRGAEHFAYNAIKLEINGAPDSAIVYMYECSHCGSMTSEEHQFCPYCGKPMYEEEQDGRN